MATLTVQVSADVMALAESRAVETGCADLSEYLARLMREDAADRPAGPVVDADDDLEALVVRRLNGPTVEMDESDFRQMRQKPAAE